LLSTLSCRQEINEQISESIISKSLLIINVKQYGAKGDGITDDSKAFQKAEDYLYSQGGGKLLVPTGTYSVSKPFYHRSNVSLEGYGDNSIIKNKVKSSNGPDMFCIYIGNFSPSQYAECVHYDCNESKKGATNLILKSKGDANNFYAGQIVLVDSKTGFMSADGHWKPYAAFINKITAIDNTSGIISLEDPITIDIPDPQIAPTNKFSKQEDTNKVYICERPVIKNIRFESNGDWAMRFGVYKGLFENISLKTTDVIPGNGFAYCTFKNITAKFSQKVIEMAMYSHNTTVDSLTATWYNGASDPAKKPLLKMGENCRGLKFSHITINSGTAKVNFDNVIRHEHSFSDTITLCHFICKNVAGAGIVHEGDASSFVVGNVCSNNIFELGGGRYYIQFDDSENATIENNIVSYNHFSGHVKDQVHGNIGQNIVVNNFFE
jgi:hypothetical protein